MPRFFVLVVALLGFSSLRADPRDLILDNQLFPSPAGVGARCPQFVSVTADAVVRLSWLEPVGERAEALRFAQFNPKARRWAEPTTVASEGNFAREVSDSPKVAISGILWASVWTVEDGPNHKGDLSHQKIGYSKFSFSRDDGHTWSVPRLLGLAGETNDHAVLVPLADTRIMAVWSGGRAENKGGASSLFARELSATSENAAITTVDVTAVAGCVPALRGFPDGSALLAFRGRSEEGSDDIKTSRFGEGRWSEAQVLNADHWHPVEPVIEGVGLASFGGRAAAAWFTASENRPRVLVSVSSDAGGQFLLPLRVEDHAPLGRVGAVMLADGSLFVSWVEATEVPELVAIWLRRISARGELSVPVLLATGLSVQTLSLPQLIKLKDDDEASPAELLLSYTAGKEPTQVVTRLISISRPEAASMKNPCNCSADETAGSPLRGRIVKIHTVTSSVSVHHGKIAGLLVAATTEFQVDPLLLKALHVESEIAARVEEREGRWWLFAVQELRPNRSAAP